MHHMWVECEDPYFLDETWVMAGHARMKKWVGKDRRGRVSKLVPGTGRRWIVGNSQGFVDDTLLIFRSNMTGEYHKEMDADQ